MDRKAAVVTGANSGIGFAVVQRLLEMYPDIRVCLACRSKVRAASASERILQQHPLADVSCISLDTSSLSSVYAAAEEIKQSFRRLDYLFLNAGIMPVTSVNWRRFWKDLFSVNVFHMFSTGEGLLVQADKTTMDGLQSTFSTNLFGHFVLLQEVEEIMGGNKRTSQIIWTSSSNARKESFNIADIQHKKGSEPYSSSKYCADLVSMAINEKWNQKGIYSHTTCPGLVMTNLTFGILPQWFWLLLLPIMMLLRIFVPKMNYSPYTGSEALVWLTKQIPQSLDPRTKYVSTSNIFGQRCVRAVKTDINKSDALQVYEELLEMKKNLEMKHVPK